MKSYLIVIVGQDFPIILAHHLPAVVICITSHVKLEQPRLLINGRKVLFPGYRWYFVSIKVDVNEAERIDVNVDAVQAVVFLLESWNFLIFGCFGQMPIEAIRPTFWKS